jgi:uncharacterized membrane protein
MSSIIESLGDLVNAVFHTITALIGSVVAVLRSFVDAILGVFQGFFHLIGSSLSGLVHTFEGLSKFLISKSKPSQSLEGSEKFGWIWPMCNVIGNIVVVGALLTGAFLYSVYQKRNGKPVTAAPAKKTSWAVARELAVSHKWSIRRARRFILGRSCIWTQEMDRHM